MLPTLATAAEEGNRPCRPPSLDITDRVIWGATRELPDGGGDRAVTLTSGYT